jgi:RNA polymerase sigma-B factor
LSELVVISGQAPPRIGRVPRDDTRLFRRYRADRHSADRDALVERYTPLARQLARRYRASDSEDVMQVAYIGLLKAIERFDPDRGLAFSSLAVPTILGEIKRYFRDLGWTVRVPRDIQELALRVEKVADALTGELGRMPTVQEIAQRCDTTAERVLEARSSATAHRAISLDQPSGEPDMDDMVDRLGSDDVGYERAEASLQVDGLLAELPDRERQVLELRFREDLMQREIADRLGISQMQVSRLIARSLATLRPESAPRPPA